MSLAASQLERNATSPSTKIRVIAVRPVNKGSLRAIVDVGLGPSLVIREFRVIQQAGQRAWVAPPARKWKDDAGKRRFEPLIELTGGLKGRVEAAILAAWQGDRGGAHG
jgi:DNA-binding cell septation regulator SpoVG